MQAAFLVPSPTDYHGPSTLTSCLSLIMPLFTVYGVQSAILGVLEPSRRGFSLFLYFFFLSARHRAGTVDDLMSTIESLYDTDER